MKFLSMQKNQFKIRRAALGAAFTLFTAASPMAGAQTIAEPRNVVQLSASGSVEAHQDWLTMTLSTTKEGSDPTAVQNYLRQVVDAALTEAKKTVQPGAMEVRTGAFSLQPRYSNDGKMSGWFGTAELVLEGADFPRIGSAAAKAQPMTIGNLNFSLSRATRVQLESQAQKLAIEGFKSKAAEIAHGFGFADYTLREVSINAEDQSIGPRPFMMPKAVRMGAAESAPVPLESGKSQVFVTVSGAIQLK
jgi:predicted secreted protein